MIPNHRISIVADCGHRERKSEVESGECRDCRGVEKPERVERGANRWNDSGEARAHRAAYNRQRVIQNDRGRR